MLTMEGLYMTRYLFEFLTYVERHGTRMYSIRELADNLCISGTMISQCINSAVERNWITIEASKLSITTEGLIELEPYRVKRAIILAAGFGSRMMPATKDKPKPMVSINGVRIIDTLLNALTAVGINDITVVGGYQYKGLLELLNKYPSLNMIENAEYASTNNISSAMAALDHLYGGCYFCEADLYLTNPEIILKYQYASNILGSYSMETDDWSFKMDDGCLIDYKKGNTYCYNYYGISYWTGEDCEKLKRDFSLVYNTFDKGKDYFWEFIPFVLMKDRYRVEIRPCRKSDIIEIDNYYELAQLDPSYK